MTFNKRRSTGWGFVILLVIVLTMNALIYIPVITHCNEVGGEVLLNAWKYPVCVTGVSVE